MALKEKADMRKSGATYQEIADACGISRQAAHQQIKAHELKFTRRRALLSRTRYKGIYDYLTEHPDESVSKFANVAFGYKGGSGGKMRGFLVGDTETRFTINQIKKICKRCGKSFEEVFAERNVDE